jgi:hypothetical protein
MGTLFIPTENGVDSMEEFAVKKFEEDWLNDSD